MLRSIAAAFAAAMLAGAPLAAQEDAGNGAEETREPREWTNRGQVETREGRIRYTVRAGETFLRDEDGNPTASIFTTTYTRDGVDDPAERPVAFVFNGGPGSASLWLHMGVVGPRRLVLPSEPPGDDGAAPFDVRDNPESLIGIADLVFIDPVGTGWSRALGETDPAEEFWGVDEDAESIAEFIRIWLTENRRWASPKYLIGESYGTTRIGALMRQLEAGWNDVAINGVVLVSVVLDFKLDHTAPGNDVGYVGLMPSYAATAWYHEKVDRSAWGGDYDAFLEDARDFATDEYMPALLRGQDIDPDRRDAVIARLAEFTGLSETYIRRANMRVSLSNFRTELLRDEGLSVGRFDGRFTGVEPDAVSDSPEGDPSGYGIDGGYTAAMLDHFTREIGVDITEPYTTLGGVREWNWDAGPAGGDNSYVNVSIWLERAMRQNAELRVLATNGIYDMATPFFATEMTFNRPGYDPDRVNLTYYPAGHMMYLHQPSIEQLAQDIRDFVAEGER
ncbi:peptidase S10 [Marinicauda salina]|uniref:Peptidase S10 n=1 Tax=Marinicauda salina TaxID=2135793 RepID=A0A2U2BRS0_9PROT|nr:peptidase S10 [Marinicauda salina]PWE16710.1 peptidase S10 [Marinicauda salina]